jgi:hypothetical protein
MSGYTNDLLVRRPGDGQDAGFLPKPFRCDTLAQKVRACLDAGPRPASIPVHD